jgi:hypothetical protein
MTTVADLVRYRFEVILTEPWTAWIERRGFDDGLGQWTDPAWSRASEETTT